MSFLHISLSELGVIIIVFAVGLISGVVVSYITDKAKLNSKKHS